MSPRRAPILVVGAGPAGLATAVGLAMRGAQVCVADPHPLPIDKACGEGLMAPGLAALARLGVPTSALEGHILTGVRYDDGVCTLCLPFDGERALGLRRTRLSEALAARATAVGVEVLQATVAQLGAVAEGSRLVSLLQDGTQQQRRFAFVVGADGLRSRVRRMAGLQPSSRGAWQRYGGRQHLAVRPWSDMIEVYLGRGAEAYVTPVDDTHINLALLATRPVPDLAAGLALVPGLGHKLGDPARLSRFRGAGPLCQPALAVCCPGVALVGDASGYVDANTGEGLSLALLAAEALAMELAVPLPTSSMLRAYPRFHRRLTFRYRLATRALRGLNRFVRLRRLLMRLLGYMGGRALLRWVMHLPRARAA